MQTVNNQFLHRDGQMFFPETEPVINTPIGLPESSVKEAVYWLNGLLADEYVLHAKARSYHWNAEGPLFYSLHLFFEKQYKALDEIIDELAGRVRELGGYPVGTLRDAIRRTELEEEEDVTDVFSMLEIYAEDQTTIVRRIRAGLTLMEEWKDAGTIDLVTGLLRQHEKMTWMARAFIRRD